MGRIDRIDRIESRDNQKLKTIRHLRRSKGKQSKASGILLEGPHLLTAALDLGLPLDMVLVTDKAAEESTSLLERCDCPIAFALPEHLAEVADADSPRGLIAVAQKQPLSVRELESMPQTPQDVLLFCSELRDPGNLGALARSAAAANVKAMLLSEGCVQPFHPRALRASAGALVVTYPSYIRSALR